METRNLGKPLPVHKSELERRKSAANEITNDRVSTAAVIVIAMRILPLASRVHVLKYSTSNQYFRIIDNIGLQWQSLVLHDLARRTGR